MTTPALSIIIPAHNEADYISGCLDALLGQVGIDEPIEVLVVPNACTDRTSDIARARTEAFDRQGWTLSVLETETPGKVNALNLGDTHAAAGDRVYLDADIVCKADLISKIRDALKVDQPVYVTGRLNVVEPKSWITRHYARLWIELPFMKSKAVGAGLFAVNSAGRRRWGKFPDIISDDTFVRLQFSPAERVEVDSSFDWPMCEGLRNLTKVRQRQDAGVHEIKALYPEIMQNEGKPEGNLIALFWRQPLDFVVYSFVSILVRIRRRRKDWARGR